MAKITIDKLAELVVNEFRELRGEINKRFEQVESRLDKIESRLDKIESRLDKIEGRLSGLEMKVGYLEASLDELRRDVRDMKNNSIDPREFEDLTHRVKYLEEKLGIESGK
ncbi:MAG: hypothetical protein L6Q29_01740 [Candidatus Pacebacteria bacterium]|nr:hypothetical protein [Candidatus Paceibacterota bacterium]